jgi:hypothetical protein
MKKLFMLLALLLLVYPSGARAADGDELSTTSFRVDSNGQVFQKALVEVPTTSDTVTAAESGKTFLVNKGTGTVTFTLPLAAAGLTYTFTAINGNATSGQGRIYLDPNILDTMVGCVNSTSTTTFAVGDSLYSPGATGDSVILVSPAALTWVCVDRTGTWVDGNTSN